MIAHIERRAVVNAFFRRWRLFLAVFLPVMLAGVAYILLATPAYESTAQLLVKFGSSARPEVLAGNAADNSGTEDEHHELMQSNVKILTSRDLAEALLNDATLKQAYPKIADRHPSSGTPMDLALKQFGHDLEVKTDSDSAVINVGLYNRDPQTATAMLSKLIDLFIGKQSEIYSNPQTAVLKDQAEQAYMRLNDADKELDDYKARAGISSIDEELTLLLQERAEIAGYLARRRAAGGSAASSAPAAITPAVAVSSARIPTSTGDRFPVLDDVQRHIDDLQARQAELSQTYNADGEVMRNLRQNISTQMGAQGAAVKALGAQIADLDAQIAEKDRRKAHDEELERSVQLAEDNYKAAEARAQEAQTDQDLNRHRITQIAVVDPPAVPYKAARPHKRIILALCFLIGAAFGLGAAVIAEILDQSFSLPEQAVAELGIPVLSTYSYRRRKAA